MALLSASSDDETHSFHLTLPDFSLYRVARAPVANAAVAYSTFESLRLGRAAQSVVARLIRFWDSHVVGEIQSMQGSDLKNNAATSRVVVRFLIERNVSVYLSLWNEAASTKRPQKF
ncbi:hypothetical protein HID58_093192 [Brassica napus]|uniref:Uncharacterized protein n=1 Tax=Brassica napus TaxID=3708 RepID=A0ABQ7XBT1_BRANA|nr:hypothetical protein HID58_093192 [Brassica napus]